MLLLAAEDPDKDIWLYINSPGGSVDSGMAIYDTMQLISNDVATVGDGPGRLDGPVPALRRREGQAFALPHARIMMHQPSGGMGGTASDIEIQAEQIAAHQGAAVQADRRAHRPAARAGRERRGPRPLVHRRRGQGLRLHRPRGRQAPRRSPPAARTPDLRTPSVEGRTYELLHPAVGGAHVVRHAPDRTLHQAVRGPDHLPRHADHRRDRERGDGPAAVPAVDGLRPRHQHLHQLPGRLVHRADRDLRHDRYIKPDIQTVCLGQAASAAAVLLAAGTPGKRLALPNSRIIIHQPATEGGLRAGPATSRSRRTRSSACARCWRR